MPCRIRLDISENDHSCDICGKNELPLYREYITKKHGINYEGAFEHPLSPHYLKGDEIAPIHTQPGGIGYRYWLGFVENFQEENNIRRPARVIQQFHTMTREDGRLWAFGYDFVPGHANVRCWYDATMPILHIDNLLSPIFSAHALNMIKASRHVSGLLVSAVLKTHMVEPKIVRNPAGYMEIKWKWPKDLLGRLKKSPTEKTKVIEEKLNAIVEELDARTTKSMISWLNSVRLNFWSTTEDYFYDHLKRIRSAIQNKNSEQPVLENWLTIIKKWAVNIFDLYAEAGDFNATDPRRVALARNEFLRSLNSNRLKNMLGLLNNANNNH